MHVRVGGDADDVLVGDDATARVDPVAGSVDRRVSSARRVVVVVVDRRRRSWVRRPGRGHRRASPRPRKTARIACMFSPSSSGISTELPWIVVGRDSIWYVVIAAGSTLLITPANSSILRVVSVGSVTMYSRHASRSARRPRRDRTHPRRADGRRCGGGSPAGARCDRGRTCRRSSHSSVERRRYSQVAVIARRRGRGRR